MPFELKSLTTVPIGKESKLNRKSMADFDASAKRTFSFFVSTRSFSNTLVVEEEAIMKVIVRSNMNCYSFIDLFKESNVWLHN
jgi:hypothetical protein